ncbi:MAG TPA: lasso peptide biosynthesis B2 protein [Allosphingosinicella sp.]|jgi:hypothetical protein
MATRTHQLTPLRRLARLSRDNRRVLVEALWTLAAASLVIRLLPFRRTAELMQGGAGRSRPDEAAAERLIAQCRWAVQRWADRVPWRAVCFQRGLTLHLMLRRRGIPSTLHYGVAQGGEKGLRAHVWITAEGRPVLGVDEAEGFACLAVYPAAPAR